MRGMCTSDPAVQTLKCFWLSLILLSVLAMSAPPVRSQSLHSAAYRGDLAAVRQYVGGGHGMDDMDSTGVAPLHYAARMGHDDVIEFLISEGAQVDIESTSKGNTPLQLACGAGHIAAAELLLAGDADIDHQNENSETALHWAVGNGRTRTVEFLLSRNADLEVRDVEGMTPLHRSVVLGYPVIVDKLLAEGANAGTKDKHGVSVMSTSLKLGYVRTARVLKLAGAALDTWKDLVTFIQNQLWLRGYGIDEVDGKAGANTSAAIRAYQDHAGIARDGAVSEALAGHLASSGEIGPYLSGDAPTVTNIFVSWHPFAHEHQWDPRLLWSRGEILDDGTQAADNRFRGVARYTGQVQFAYLEVVGTAWVLANGWVIGHGSRVSLKPATSPPTGY